MSDVFPLTDYARAPGSDPSPQVTSPEDVAILNTIGKKYKALAPHVGNAAVIQTPDMGDGRQLEFHHPISSENPVPGKMTFQMFRPFEGAEREDAIAADALHYIGGRKEDDAGDPIDPKWSGMREKLWEMRSPVQKAVDQHNYDEDHEEGQTFDAWANRNRKDAYVRAGIFPERNPDWNRGPDDPMGWTPAQKAHFAEMRGYLERGDSAETTSGRRGKPTDVEAAKAALDRAKSSTPGRRAQAAGPDVNRGMARLVAGAIRGEPPRVLLQQAIADGIDPSRAAGLIAKATPAARTSP